MSDNPWLAAGRDSVAAVAADRIRAAGTDTEVDAILRAALSAVLGRSVSVRLRGSYTSIETVREMALGLLRAASRTPETFPRAVLTQRLPAEDRTYAVTRTTGDEPGILFVDAELLLGRNRRAFAASLVADGTSGRPNNASDLMEHHVATTRAGAGEHRSRRSDPKHRSDPLQRHEAIRNARSVSEVATHLRAAASDITGAPVEVDLGTDVTTDLSSVKRVAQGLVMELLDARHEGMTAIEVGELPAPHADAYAVTAPQADGGYKVVFNSRWHTPERSGQLHASLGADGAYSTDAPGNTEELGARHAAPPPAEQPKVSASPRGEVTPYESLHRIDTADSLGDIGNGLREGLGTTLGHEVEVSFVRSTDIETAREFSGQLVRSALERPDAKLRAVRVAPLPREVGKEFAHTKVHPDGSYDVVFNWQFHAGDAREEYLDALRTAHREGRIPDPTPAGIAELRFEVLGTTALTPTEYVERIRNATSTTEVEGYLREALVSVTGAPATVELQAPGSRHVTSVESAKDVACGLIESGTEHPGTPLSSVRVAEIPDEGGTEVDMKTYAQAHGWKDRPADLVFNAPWHSVDMRDDYVKSLDEDARTKFTVGGNPYGVAVHELGHGVSRYNEGWMERTDIPGHPGTLHDEVRAGVDRPNAEWEELAESVSRYSKKNDQELTAESVGDVHRNGAGAAAVSTVIVTRLQDAHRARLPPLEPFRREVGPAEGAEVRDLGLRGLGSVDTMREDMGRQRVEWGGTGVPGDTEVSREHPVHTPATGAETHLSSELEVS